MTVARRTSWYFLSSLGVPILGLMTLPIFTTRLGPEQFGSFALGSSLAAIASATAAAVSTLNLPTELGRLTEAEQPHYITAVFALALLTAVLSCALVFPVYIFASRMFGLEALSSSAAWLSIVGGLLNSIWATCVEILTIQGRARTYAINAFLQAVGNALCIAVALFLFHEIEYALFWGFVASALIGALGAVIALHYLIKFHQLRTWLPVAKNGALAAVMASAAENGKVAIERAYLAGVIGVAQLGFLAHAQYYKNAAMVVLNAISRGVLPTALEEAQQVPPRFTLTLRLWALVQAFALSAALGFALLGRDVIGLLTHNKFSDSAPYAVALMLVLLLQTAAKPHLFLLMARGRNQVNANVNTLSTLLALVWLFASVPWLGIWGAISAVYLQMLIHRISVYCIANRITRLPFSDSWVVIGTLTVCLCNWAQAFLSLGLFERMGLLVLIYAFMFWKLSPVIMPKFVRKKFA